MKNRALALTMVCAMAGIVPAQILLDGELPATGSDLGTLPLVTAYGTITFTGEFRGNPSDPEFIAAGAFNNIYDIGLAGGSSAWLDFDFDVREATFIYGGNGGNITIEARDAMGGIVDSFFQASTGAGEPAGPLTLLGGGIRQLWWMDTGGSFAPLDNITIEVGVGCTVVTPPSPAAGDVLVDFTSASVLSMTVDASFEYSLDSGMTYSPCTASVASPLPNPALATPVGPGSFLWDSVFDGVGLASVAVGVLVRVTVDDGVSPAPGVCETAAFDVDNVPPTPTCTLGSPFSVASGDVPVQLDSASVSSPTIDATFEYSLDGGATYAICTAAAASLLANPTGVTPTGLQEFLWDSRADGVGTTVIAPGVLVRASVDDGVAPTAGQCVTTTFDVDNTSLCGGICGDCNLDAMGPTILDALVGAQIAAGLVVPTPEQVGCCDVNTSMTVDVIDALQMAQDSAGLPVSLTCP